MTQEDQQGRVDTTRGLLLGDASARSDWLFGRRGEEPESADGARIRENRVESRGRVSARSLRRLW